jgi:hypothetical protein
MEAVLPIEPMRRMTSPGRPLCDRRGVLLPGEQEGRPRLPEIQEDLLHGPAIHHLSDGVLPLLLDRPSSSVNNKELP